MTHHEQAPVDQKLDEGRQRPFLNTPTGFAFCVFLVIAGIFLWIEHRAHIFGALPLLLLLMICLGMHFFMHRGHGGHKGRGNER